MLDTDFNPDWLELEQALEDAERVEQRAADYCYAQFLAADDPVTRAAYLDAATILRNRDMRHKFRPITNTSEDLKHEQRGRHCGQFTLQGTARDGRGKKYSRLNCKCWNCQYCGPRKARRYKVQIAKEAARLRLSRLVTLTLDPKKTPTKNAVKEIKAIWARFRAQLCKRYAQLRISFA